MDVDERTMQNVLKQYIPIRYWDLYDWKLIIHRKKEVEKNVYCFDCHFIKLYFNKDMKPITYGNQKVINNKVYYNFNADDNMAGTYTFLGTMVNI